MHCAVILCLNDTVQFLLVMVGMLVRKWIDCDHFRFTLHLPRKNSVSKGLKTGLVHDQLARVQKNGHQIWFVPASSSSGSDSLT